MPFSIRTFVVSVPISILAVNASHPASATLMVPQGLSSGDQYQLVFNSRGFTNALSSDIGFYDNFVQAAADLAGIGASEGIAWKAIASTASIDARDYAIVGASTPVYNLQLGQLEKVADGFNDMWDGAVGSLLAYDEYGQSNTIDAWTGSLPSGLRATGSTLGHASGTAWCGRPWLTDGQWITYFEPSTSTFLHVYALSAAITVTDGDFNGDDRVDGADFLQWQRGESPNPSSQYDLSTWQANYGSFATFAAITHSVPETGAGILMMIGLAAMIPRRGDVSTLVKFEMRAT